MRDLKVPGARGMVEVNSVIGERLSRPVGKCAAAEPDHRIGQGTASGLQMALHAQFQLSFRTQLRGIDDGTPDCREVRGCRLCRPRVIKARTVTALTINPFGNPAWEHGYGAPSSRSSFVRLRKPRMRSVLTQWFWVTAGRQMRMGITTAR
jgi:hypothetical protein